MALAGKTILITGAARRIGRYLALTAARAGADVILHHSHSPEEAQQVAAEIEGLGRRAWLLQADFAHPEEVEGLVARASALAPLYGLVNNAAIFDPLGLAGTTLAGWQRTLDINLTAPFLLSRDFGFGGDGARQTSGQKGRIVNIVDWRALRPAADHFAYTISKAGLAALTRSLAAALAPDITVNALALGAICRPATRVIRAGCWPRSRPGVGRSWTRSARRCCSSWTALNTLPAKSSTWMAAGI